MFIAPPFDQWLDKLAEHAENETEIITFQDVQEEAEKTPLDQTLLKVTLAFTNETPEKQDPYLQQLDEKITQLKELVENSEPIDLPENIIFTPQMTALLIEIIEDLGYQNPHETLIEYAKSSDIKLLVFTLCKINQPDLRDLLHEKKILGLDPGQISSNKPDIRNRIAQVISKLITPRLVLTGK